MLSKDVAKTAAATRRKRRRLGCQDGGHHGRRHSSLHNQHLPSRQLTIIQLHNARATSGEATNRTKTLRQKCADRRQSGCHAAASQAGPTYLGRRRQPAVRRAENTLGNGYVGLIK